MILTRLRTETRALHQQVEASLNLTRPGRSVRDHVALLGGFLGYHEPFEARSSDAAPQWRDELAKRRKSPALKRDLAHLGLSDREIAALPRCNDLPRMTGAAEVLGAMYVVEGSTLGGRVLARLAERTLGLRDGRGYSFFLSYGPGVDAMWRDFTARLEAWEPSSPGDHDRLVAAARETFQTLNRWLTAPRGAA